MKAWLSKKYMLIGIPALIIVILAISSFFVFSNHGKDKPFDADESSDGKLVNITDKGTIVPKRKVYPIGKWEMDIPYLNPFGSQNNYQSVEFAANQYRDLHFIDGDNMEASRMTVGDTWKLQVDWKDDSADPIDDLLLYIAELGGESHLGTQDGEWVVSAVDSEGDRWWGVTWRSGKGYTLTVNKEYKLRNGQTATFNTKDYSKSEIYFLTENTDHRYQSLKVAMAGGSAQLVGKGTYEQGQYSRRTNYVANLYAYKTNQYSLDDITQECSVPLLWRLSWDTNTDPGKVDITLDEAFEISPVRSGERLGALKVRGDMLGFVQVEAQQGLSITHPELNLKGDKTPEGDTLFWLPSGYWNVSVKTDPHSAYAETITSRLVPISEGEMTILDVMPLVANTYANPDVGNSDTGERRLYVEEIAAQGNLAKISFMLLDSESPKFTPNISNTEIVEGGKLGKIVKLERIQTSPSVVLALDSSGSMKGSMEKVLASARTFIQGLPDKTHIQIIDFDSEIRILNGETKTEVLKSLDTVQAKGDTALYDAVMSGLSLLNDAERPTLLVFTDGVDSSTEPRGKGSKATKEQVIKAVKDSGIPLFTIGFGPGHDNTTLLELAGITEGTYYSAQDTKALDNVFTSINDRLGNRFEATYERPKEQAPSDIPIISIAVDISGSMDVDPTTGFGDYRIDKVKNLLHEFIKQIPDDSLMQMASFNDTVFVDQVFTNRKSEILQALGNLRAAWGTDILGSTTMSYKSVTNIPSEKRVIVYVTDAALDVKEELKDQFIRHLTGIKEDGIQVLWVGLGTEEAEDAFRFAAEKSGGSYVISEDPEVLAKAFQKVLADVQNKPARNVSLAMTITNDSIDGKARQYTANALTEFPALRDSGDKVTLSAIHYEPGAKIAQYEAETASLLYGRDIPGEDVQIYKRLPVNVKGKNKAIEWSASEIYFLKRLKGVNAPYRSTFMAVEMDIKNIHSEGATYIIPDFAAHFFASMNNSGSFPASMATWLAENALTDPGESSVSIKPDETIHGALIFLVPDDNAKQLSLNFYDVDHGHISLALIGEPQQDELVALSKLPTVLTGKLSDAFSMTLKASSELDRIEGVQLKSDTSYFKVVEADLRSNVQADLKMDPRDRFYLNVKSDKGPLLIPVNTATALLPYGFLRPVTLGPGSSSMVRFAFQAPSALRNSPMELYADLKGGGMSLPVSGSGSNKAVQNFMYDGDGFKVSVNAAVRVRNVGSYSGNYIVADITVADEQDGRGTSGFRSAFTLTATSGSSDQGDITELRADPITDKLLLGINDDWAVFDGTSRRGFLVFAIPSGQTDLAWTLQSEQFPDFQVPVKEDSYKDIGLLVDRVDPPVDGNFNIQLATALAEVMNRHKSLTMTSSTNTGVRTADLDEGRGDGVNVPVPSPVVYGLTRLNSIKTMADFQATVEGLQWLPSPDSSWMYYRNSPESVLTQGWGNEGDLANLAGGLLAQLGYTPSLRMVNVTDRGREALQQLGNVDEAKQREMPAWVYIDDQGKSHIFVVPFMKDLSELKGLAFFPAGQVKRTMTPIQSTISVYYKVEPKPSKNRNTVIGSIGDALGGGDGSSKPVAQEVRMLNVSLPLAQLGKEPMDVRVGGKNGLYKAVLENRTIQIEGDNTIDPSKYDVKGVRIEVQMPEGKLVHETALREGEQIASVFQTIAVNIPDLPDKSANTLQKAADRAYKAAAKPDVQSTLVWYTRNILYRFITNQTKFENELARTLDVTAGRTKNERVLVVTVHKDASPTLRTNMDLLQSANRLHRATKEAASAFNMMSGLFASRLEGAVLPGNKADFMEVWSRSPEDTNLFLFLPYTSKDDLEYMKTHGYPEFLIERAKNSDKAMLIPSKSTRIYGEDRWTWLEIDPKTYETISLLDTGEHGGFAEYVMASMPEAPSGDDYLQFVAGGFIGVDVSVWSIAAFSLVMDDYEDIWEAAKAYTYGICEVLDGMMSNKDLAKLEYSVGKVKFSYSPAEYDYLAKYFEQAKDGKISAGHASLVGFKDGFKAGAAYYFEQSAPDDEE